MRYLALLLLAPWLLILGWAYFAYPKSLPRTVARRLFDVLVLLATAVAAVLAAQRGFDTAPRPELTAFGTRSGAIWQQVSPALYGYGAATAVLAVATLLRLLIWRRSKEVSNG